MGAVGGCSRVVPARPPSPLTRLLHNLAVVPAQQIVLNKNLSSLYTLFYSDIYNSVGPAHYKPFNPAHDKALRPAHDKALSPAHNETLSPAHDEAISPAHDAAVHEVCGINMRICRDSGATTGFDTGMFITVKHPFIERFCNFLLI